MSLQVIVVGGGIAGFATALGFATYGHDVTVMERRQDESEESGSAIQFQPNAIKILKRWGMMEDLAVIAHDNCRVHLVNGLTGIQSNDIDREKYGGPWIGHRKDMRILFQKTALRRGVKLIFGQTVKRVEEKNDRPCVILEDGSRMIADLVIGADGTRSKVRQSLFPGYRPTVLPEACFQIRVPFSTMLADPDTAPFLEKKGAQMFTSPERSTFSSVIYNSKLFDLQLIDHRYKLEQDPHPDTWTERWKDMEFLQRRWGDHFVGFQKIIRAGQSAYKWRFVEINKLPSWSSPSGRIILVGDACHAMPPHSGQGSAMGIEDAAVLSLLFQNASPHQDLSQLAKMYQDIRLPRCNVIQALARNNGRSFAAVDPEMQKKRNILTGRFNDSIQASTNPGLKPDMKAHFTSPEFARWLDDWDADFEVRAAMKHSGLDKPHARL